MIIYPSLPSGHTIFCDDVRQEVTGKVTLVGTYSSHMLVAEFPAVVPRICCAITFREEMLAFGEVAIRVIHEQGGDETIVAEVKFEVKEDQVVQPDPTQDFVMREGKFALEILGLNISGPGALKTRAFKGGDEIRLGALQIAPLPSLPAAQSD